MLKITKNLIVDCITTHTDDEGNEYVRVKMGGEDFCIAAHSYTAQGKYYFSWDEAMELLKADGLTTFTKDQALICNNNLNKINDILKEIDGETLERQWYWTSTEYDAEHAWFYNVANEYISASDDNGGRKNDTHVVRVVRPIINL